MVDPSGTNTNLSQAPTGAAGGDLSGSFPNPGVAKIAGTTAGPGATAAAGQLPGTATGDSAAAGNVGEFVSTSLVSGSGVNLSTGVATTVVALPLTSGDWTVWGAAVFSTAVITVVTALTAGISTTAGNLPGLATGAQTQTGLGAGLTGIVDSDMAVGPLRMNFSATTTTFLVAALTFATSTAKVYGYLQARRSR